MHIKKKVSHFIFIFFLGEALLQLGSFEDSSKMYDEALEINPNDSETYCNKGWTFFIYLSGAAIHCLGKFDEAIRIYDMAL